MPSEGGSSRVYVAGLRNAVGLWVDTTTGRAWATNMGRDSRETTCKKRSTRWSTSADAGWPRCRAKGTS